MPPDRIAPAANTLIDTLHAEIEALDTLEDLYDQQLEAVRTSNMDPIGERTTEIQEQTAALEELSEKSKRQARLLGRVLGTDSDEPSLEELIRVLGEEGTASELGTQLKEAKAAVSERVEEVNQHRETLRLSLEYAADLNHELLTAMQEAASDADAQTYTAEGQSEPAPPDRFFVDATG